MSDPTETVVRRQANPSPSPVEHLADEIGDSAALGKKIADEAKTIGYKKALAKHAPEVIREIKEDIAAVKGAMPDIKAGYKTTEFWLVAGLLVANSVMFALTGKALPFDVNAISGTLIGIYTAVRGLVKKG